MKPGTVTMESVVDRALKLGGPGMANVKESNEGASKLIDLSVLTGASAVLAELLDADFFTDEQIKALVILSRELDKGFHAVTRRH